MIEIELADIKAPAFNVDKFNQDDVVTTQIDKMNKIDQVV